MNAVGIDVSKIRVLSPSTDRAILSSCLPATSPTHSLTGCHMAFCSLIDSHALLPGISDIFIGDRGYCF